MTPAERKRIKETVAKLEQRLVRLHARRDAATRAVQEEIVTLHIRICDLRAIAATSDKRREAINFDRHKFAEQQRQLLKMGAKDRYHEILDRQEEILKAGHRLAELAAAQV